MHWKDRAIILSARKLGEYSGIIHALSREYGLTSGVSKHAFSSKSRGVFQPGNIVELEWKARLPEHMGSISAEMQEGFAAYAMDSRLKLMALTSACSLIEKTLPEREPQQEIYDQFTAWLRVLKSDDNWLAGYVFLELSLLKNAGFGLNLLSCAATERTDDLAYVSPKSGRAVCRDAGTPYHDKLLKLPQFLLETQHLRGFDYHQIVDGMLLTGYFLERRLFEMRGTKPPQERQRLLQLVAELKTSSAGKELEASGTT